MLNILTLSKKGGINRIRRIYPVNVINLLFNVVGRIIKSPVNSPKLMNKNEKLPNVFFKKKLKLFDKTPNRLLLLPKASICKNKRNNETNINKIDIILILLIFN